MEKHIPKCTAREFDEKFEEESTIPYFCPQCEEKLELDIDPDGSARVYCPNCDFIEELDETQLTELNQYEEDDISDKSDILDDENDE